VDALADGIQRVTPEPLLRKLVGVHWRFTIARHALFSAIEEQLGGFLAVMMPKLRPVLFVHGQPIARAGQAYPTMWFVEDGCCSTRSADPGLIADDVIADVTAATTTEIADAGAGEGKETSGKGERKQGRGAMGDDGYCTVVWEAGEYFGEQGLLVPIGEAFGLRNTVVAGEHGIDTASIAVQFASDNPGVLAKGGAAAAVFTEVLEFRRPDFLHIEEEFPIVGACLRDYLESNPSFVSEWVVRGADLVDSMRVAEGSEPVAKTALPEGRTATQKVVV
jgi:hypothetical protein